MISTRVAVANLRFRSEQHLRRPGEIRAVREQGRRVECRAFTLWWKRRDLRAGAASPQPAELPPTPSPVALPRVCVIATTAAVGGATRRNRAKRRLREVFRHQQHVIPAGCDLLLIARAAATNWPLSELERKFSEACAQIPAAPAQS